MARTLRHILPQVIKRPHAYLGELDLITESEKACLHRWNLAIPPSPRTCVHDAIVENCVNYPDRLAVSAWDGDLTYQVLYGLSTSLAVHLRALDLPPGTIIPLCFEKSKWAIVAVLGTLRSGAAYVFVDPDSPHARKASICEDVNAQVMLCSPAQLSKATELAPQAIVVETVVQDMPTKTDITLPAVKVEDPVYAVFTSGSTGRPKGVVIEHGGFFQRAMANGPELSLSCETRILQFASFVFDVANRDILYTLLFGGCICIPSESQRSNDLAAFINQKEVNWVSITPSVAKLLEPSAIPSLRHMVSCGEPMTSSMIVEWAGSLQLINAYGPSEATTISSLQTNCTIKTCPANIGKGSGSVLWIVDPADHNRLAPIGAVGELVIESPSVGKGYINRPTETKSSFLSTTSWLPLFRSGQSDLRLYKTGDLVQYDSDGSILFRGRKDAQVKIRGQRVDLGEIEHWIQKCLPPDNEVKTVVEFLKPLGRETGLLVGFLAPSGAPSGSLQANIPFLASELNKGLSQNLPEYMIPRVYYPVEEIPMTATGKTHREKLRQIGGSLTIEELMSPLQSSTTSGPLSERLKEPVGHILLGLWASALGIKSSSIRCNDSFLGLGGDSIMAIRVATQARSEGIDLSVADMMEFTKLGDLLDIITKRPKICHTAMSTKPFSLVDVETSSQVVASNYGEIIDILPTTEAQNFFLTQWTVSCYTCILQGEIDVGRLQAACRAVVSRHDILRTVFIKNGSRFLQLVTKSFDPPFDRYMADTHLETACPLAVERIIAETGPISRRPIVSFTLISESSQRHALLVRVSHAQYDGNTSPILFRDVSTAYDSVESEPFLQTATPFSRYLYARSMGPSHKAFEFWRENFRGASMTFLDPSTLNGGESSFEARIIAPASGPLPLSLRDLTVPTLINATISLLLSELVQKEDVIFGTVMDTRTLGFPGIETTLGPCININPLRAHVQPQTMTFRELCHSLQSQYANITRHAYCDLSDIVANCTDWHPETKLGCMVNHLRPDEGPPPLSLDGLRCTTFKKTAYITLSHQVLFRCITGKERLDIQVLTSTTMMNSAMAQSLAERLVTGVCKLASSPDVSLGSLSI
ncbi:Nonribosomal peptide synthetase 12 [Penicillium subrubescens]|uniref:Nonribosomal peptide synthetase 12 n=2 Tax=Penicillium subrubescens TaxID=1316194 RepID=A0A1Q5SXH9_9EURO|nr:Nonribosomal peptide synthetase 12 [Penicillium subrubescens]